MSTTILTHNNVESVLSYMFAMIWLQNCGERARDLLQLDTSLAVFVCCCCSFPFGTLALYFEGNVPFNGSCAKKK